MDYDPTDVEEQQRESEEARRLEKNRRDEANADFKWLMNSRRGRRIVWKWLERSGVFRSSFNQNAMLMSFNEGTRNEGLRILAEIHALCPDKYPVMTEENASDRRNESRTDGGSDIQH